MSAPHPESIGILNENFFVGKAKLIQWVNDLLKINIKKVEEMATGAYHCQLLDMIYPGKVPLHKVNFHAKFDYEYVKNYKVLQEVFTQQAVSKYVDVDKLVKAKYQDNLEFFQWMKSFFDSKYSGQNYNPVERREHAMRSFGKKLPASSKKALDAETASSSSSSSSSSVSPSPSRHQSISTVSALSSSSSASSLSSSSSTSVSHTSISSKTANIRKKTKPFSSSSSTNNNNNNSISSSISHTSHISSSNNSNKNNTSLSSSTQQTKVAAENEAKLKEMSEQFEKLKTSAEGLEKERNFYFKKLRQIEILCQDDKAIPPVDLKKRVLEILYRTDDEDFECPNADTHTPTNTTPTTTNPSTTTTTTAPGPAPAPVPIPTTTTTNNVSTTPA
eukprot:TRINITY_DN194_c4_g1_i1.p1 TRINITY_DN194_c4_g1~~TRINITY_DN194_c4_g1_i1.p1  ORF type:complete len:389 (+),score=152.98 TRINITY_DN194_c4_g1_i1:86-1252(+)